MLALACVRLFHRYDWDWLLFCVHVVVAVWTVLAGTLLWAVRGTSCGCLFFW